MISIVLPVFNEQEVIHILAQRLRSALEPLDEPYELIFVNDGSSDQTQTILEALRAKDERIKFIKLSRNFGHQTAVAAGLDFATGEVVGLMDSDLQDPPEVMVEMLRKQREGFDVVFAIRASRKEHLLKQLMYKSFYRVLDVLTQSSIPVDSGDFCAMSRRAVDALKSLPERNRFVRGLRSWIGFSQIGYEYHRDARHAGEPKYSIKQLFRLAFDGIFSFSVLPLRLASVLGLMISLASFIMILVVMYLRIFTNTTVGAQGWASTVIVLLFLGGVQLVTIGIIGEYQWRIYEEVRQRPLYLVDRTGGITASVSDQAAV